ncbi:MAG: hypothetical protein AAFV53_33990 [Myxococcota bacterium]
MFWIGVFQDTTACVLTPVKKSDAFIDLIQESVRTGGRPRGMMQGVMTRLSTGTLVVSTRSDALKAARLYARLCVVSDEVEMPSVSLIQLSGQKVVRGLSIVNLSSSVSALAEIKAGANGVFFIVQDETGASEVRFSTHPERLKQRFMERKVAAPEATITRGRVRFVSGRGFVLRSALSVGRLTETVEGWVAANQEIWPSIRPLTNASFQQSA